MNTTFRIGRIAGIEVGVNWTWFGIFALIVWTLAKNIFPDENPGLSDTTYIAMGAIAAIAFFASLLAHELGHALQARRDGMEIEGITLWLLGGVAKFRGNFPTAGAEFRIAIAGPLVSLILGVGFVLISRLSLPATVDSVISWLGYINLALLVFNLIPALPLDGGRILRSALWHFKKSHTSSTYLSAAIGRLFGYGFIAGGIVFIILDGTFQGLWLGLIGWFLIQSSGAEAQYAANTRNLDGLTFRDLMTHSPVTIPAHATLAQFIEGIAPTHRHTTYPVVDEGKPLGLLIFNQAIQVPRTHWETKRVSECMVPLSHVQVFDADTPARDALTHLVSSPIRRGLVMDQGELVGLVSIRDLVRTLNLKSRESLLRRLTQRFLPKGKLRR